MLKRNNKTELITGIDIGSTSIRIAVGQLSLHSGGRENLRIIGAVEVPSTGIYRGAVSSIEEAISSVSHALEQIQRLIGAPIEHIWVGIGGVEIKSQESRGMVSVAKADGEIAYEDKLRAIESAQVVAPPLNYEVMHVMPHTFVVDGQIGIKDPVGMTGTRLEVNVKIIYGLSAQLKNINKTIYRSGLEIDDVVLTIIAAGKTVSTPKQRELGVVVVNFGGTTTSLAVYEEGEVTHTAILPIGSEHITHDLSLGLQVSADTAEKIKIKYGHSLPKSVSKRDKITITTGEGGREEVPLRYVAEIINARVGEILEKIDEELNSIGKSALLPAGAVFIGGGANTKGLVDVARTVLRLPVALGYPVEIESITPRAYDLVFVGAVGLVKWGSNINYHFKDKKSIIYNATNKFWRWIRKLGKWLIP